MIRIERLTFVIADGAPVPTNVVYVDVDGAVCRGAVDSVVRVHPPTLGRVLFADTTPILVGSLLLNSRVEVGC